MQDQERLALGCVGFETRAARGFFLLGVCGLGQVT